IEALAEEGGARARYARDAIHHLDHYISGTQLGITLASLGLGWVGESTLATVFVRWFSALPASWGAFAGHAVAVAVAFALITFLHIVVGELAPKSLALLFPEKVTLWTAPPLIVFSRVTAPFIWLLNGSASLVLRAVGLSSPHEVERVHRPEEIEMLLNQSLEHGLLAEEPVEMIRGVFDLSETSAAEVMMPRTQMVAVSSTISPEELADVFIDSGHSRIPVYEGSIDHIVGVVLARDFWRARRDRRAFRMHQLIRPIPFVPENKDIEHLLREMQREGIHIVIVLDEYGGTAGLVTVEDLVEEIVGEIADEHEVQAEEIREEGGSVILAGRVLVPDLNERFHLELPEEEYTTVAGFVMGRLGRVAEEGDEVDFPGGQLKVLSMAGRRVELLELTLEEMEERETEEE
ncbi:MAG TPA: hemolysin family protein, partial [Longimicrobiaceae bacterium]|nr:hemolysin family protein [Longimicrobiaceae bacterium]